MIGIEQEKCIDINIPAQTLSQVISGAGRTVSFIPEYELNQGKRLIISATYIPLPKNVNDLQDAYLIIDDYNADVRLE
jgi:hypothetical protein